MRIMPSKPPVVFPQELRLLKQTGERIRLARLRRKLSSAAVATRAGISRSTLYKLEAGDAGVTMGTCLSVLSALGLEGDFNALAADDRVGRRLQDLAMDPSAGPSRQRTRRTPVDDSAESKEDGA
ncbi:helix-turn-helix domain-containing protein [Ditylenchus destructor]|nr:helix-turn-helix domain-containing protein [Ditylenchus destructor]